MTSDFAILDATHDRERWLALLAAWPDRQVFAHPAYLELFLGADERAVCAVYRGPEGTAVQPLILRSLAASSFAPSRPAWDAVAPPYGYAGPFVIDGDPDAVWAAFYERYRSWAYDLPLIAEYVTFDPKQDRAVPYPGQVSIRAPTVLRSCDIGKEAIWNDYKGSVRTDVRNARQLALTLEVEQDGRHVREFHEVYEATMDRNAAAASYHLTLDFLERLNATLRGYYVYVHCREEGRLISTELALVSGDSTFFFRGGTLGERLRTRANLLLKHYLIEWSANAGKRWYLLGGGNSSEDSLFKYKRAFAPRGVRDLYVGKWLANEGLYRECLEARRARENAGWEPRAGFFPAYRAP